MIGQYSQDTETNSKFYGVYMGKVVTNVDPQSQNRLSVIVPQVSGNELVEDVAPCLPPIDLTTITLPTVGSQVWIMFEGGDLSHPIWIGVGQ